MIYFILSDIHEDYYSLEKIIETITKERKTYQIQSLGDNVGYSIHYELGKNKRNSNKCIDLLRINEICTVLGNHDLNFMKKKSKIPFFIYPQNWDKLETQKKITYTSVWLYLDELPTNISPENMDYLNKNSEDFLIESNLLFSHFLYPDFNGNLILKKGLVDKLLPVHFIFMEINSVKISFVGHLHLLNPIIISDKKEKIELKDGESIVLDTINNRYTVFCPPVNTYKSNKSKFISYCDTSRILRCHLSDTI